MSVHAPNHDDALFDRLVDGELSPAERQRLLASLDDRADGWRRCALAFLEAQSWRGAMNRMVSEPASVGRTMLGAPSGRWRSASHAGAWLAAAAAVVAAFSVGWQLSGGGAGAVPESVELAGQPLDVRGAPDAPAVIDELPAGPDLDAITLVVQDRHGMPQRVQVPLVEGGQLGGPFDQTPAWLAPAMRRQLAERGLNLQGRRRYAPLYFEQDDRVVPMIVPVDDAVITPVSRPVY